MGVLLSVLYRRLFLYPNFKICLIGLDNAGKTTILFQLHCNELVDTQPTLGSNVEEVKHKNVTFNVWDLGGQETLRHSWSTYYVNTNAIILVVDSTDVSRMSIVQNALRQVLTHEALTQAVILVYANKSDCVGHLSTHDIVDALGLSTVLSHQWHIQSCCALTGEGLYEGIDWITQKCTANK